MEIRFAPFAEIHRKPVIDICNYYILEGFAAYPEVSLPYEAFDLFKKTTEGYPAFVAVSDKGIVAGFGCLHAHKPFPTFSGVAELTYFLSPEYCRQGIGSQLLRRLLLDGAGQGIETVLASISAPNTASIQFHIKHGFVECGHFRSILRKKGTVVDILWMQKMLKKES